MKILGLHPMGPNTASCLWVDGKVVAFAEEERFTRVKLASDAIPVRSSAYCLKEGGLSLDDIDAITIGWNNPAYPDAMRKFYSESMNHPNKDEYSFLYEDISLNQKNPKFFNKRLEIAYRRSGHQGRFPAIHYYPHHLCHAYSVYYPSPFEEALILIIDGSGEQMATSIWIGRGNDVSMKEMYALPNSLGYFYAALTEYLGFSVFTGEGKVMGLAPYGHPNLEIRKKLDKIIWQEGDGYRVDPEYIYFSKRTFSFRHTDKLVELFGQNPRQPESALTDWHRDLAWETQYKLEQIVEQFVRKAVAKYKIKNVCIAGGVAMNCKMNGHVASLDVVENCYVIPASTDAGCALGSAIVHGRKEPQARAGAQKLSAYTGPSYSREHIKALLDESKIPGYKEMADDELCQYVAGRLKDGAIVGWFQGRMEVGARALGNRSILANPAFPNMKDKINKEVKHREAFRPFAPAILHDQAHKYFAIKPGSSYLPYHAWMLQAAQILPDVKGKIMSVVHVDNSIRPQIVSPETNPMFHKLLSAFYKVSGTPVLLNTSFNVRGEPIVCAPAEALRCHFSTGLDLLVLGNFVIEKAPVEERTPASKVAEVV